MAYGENADDMIRPDRPGSRAASNHSVLRPLADAGLGKAAVRAMARALQAEPALVGPAGSKLAEAIARVRGRVVFVGANASGTFDLKELPVGKVEPGVLLHWTAWTNLVANNFITRMPRWLSLVVGGAMVGLLLLLAGRWPGLTVPAVAALGSQFESVPTVIAAQFGISATCPASRPMVMDFGSGFQPSLSSGIRSSALRVFAISWSNSGSKD